MALAIFDLDHTLLSADSDHSWGQFLVDLGLVDPDTYQQRNDYFYEQYKRGELEIYEYLEFAMKPLTEHPLAVLLETRTRFLKEIIEPLISDASRELIQSHKDKGDTLLIITATNGFVTYPIAEQLNIEHIIAPHPEVIDGSYTGKIVGTPSYKHGKVERLNDWLKEHQHSLEGSYFYSDSHNDLPLLREVDYPVAVDPDDTLRAIAEEQGWPIISLACTGLR